LQPVLNKRIKYIMRLGIFPTTGDDDDDFKKSAFLILENHV